jgi:hypothetical protein
MRALILFALALFAGGCTVSEVVVATIDTDGGADAQDEPQPMGNGECTTQRDCMPTEFCARSDCGQSRGVCQVRPLSCDGALRPACGCDGVTYWNECLSEQRGVAHMQGFCRAMQAHCMTPDGTDCPVPGASCSRVIPGGQACMPLPLGNCWVLPPDCTSAMGPPDRYSPCNDPHMCAGMCDAIRSGAPYSQRFPPQCPH